jgi:hypothetical protein
MFKRSFRPIIVTLLCLAYVGLADAFTLQAEDGFFTAEFPREPMHSKKNIQAPDGTPVEYSTWGVDNGDYQYFVLLHASKTAMPFDYDTGTSSFVTRMKGKLISEQPFRLQDITGREVFVEAGPSVFRSRFLFVNQQRVYQIVYIGPRGTENSADARTFLNSFRLQK